MGGEHDRMTAAEAASVLGWWIEAGVDVAIQEKPRAWLGEAATHAPSAPMAMAEPEPTQDIPTSLEAFRGWLGESQSLPFAAPSAKRVLPRGIEAADIMLLADMPTPEDIADGQPIGGAAWDLTQRMLAAIGFDAEQAYVASLTCTHSPGMRLAGKDLEACAAIARRHVALAKPKRLLLLGDAPARALLGKPLAAARGHVHKIEGVRTVASFHPRHLLQRASDKALAWRDLLLLMEEEV
jgi:uracil-DNA glycosylase